MPVYGDTLTTSFTNHDMDYQCVLVTARGNGYVDMDMAIRGKVGLVKSLWPHIHIAFTILNLCADHANDDNHGATY